MAQHRQRVINTNQPSKQLGASRTNIHSVAKSPTMSRPANPLPMSVDYSGHSVALLTQHGKEQVITPVLASALGCQVQHVSNYDTDLLGTFTREIPRAGTQIEAARKKARIGMQLAGLPLGLASEGSFGPDPMMGMFPWNVEYLIWIDDLNGIEIVSVAQDKANFAHLLTQDWAQAESFAQQWGFPDHQLVIRPDDQDDPRIQKGIACWSELLASYERAQQQSKTGRVFLETDVRAHANPTRLSIIRAAAEDLARRLLSACPSCASPGFWVIERIPGLPCTDCGAPTRETRADILACVRCHYRQTRERTDKCVADAGRCSYCNP